MWGTTVSIPWIVLGFWIIYIQISSIVTIGDGSEISRDSVEIRPKWLMKEALDHASDQH
jgi:hypothetical protein